MRLLLSVPAGVLVDAPALKVSAEADFGAFTLLPRHADCALLLVPGLLSYVDGGVDEGAAEVFVAVDDGILVKTGADVRVACQRAAVAGDLSDARTALEERLRQQDESAHRSRAALSRLESEVLRKMGDLL